jgi:hypothetical protein
MCVLLRQLVDLTNSSDKEQITSTIKKFEFMNNREFSINILNDRATVFIKWSVNGHQQMKCFTIKGNFKKMSKLEFLI